MINNLAGGTDLQKGFMLMIIGVSGVFFVLILFYVLIKVITRLFPENKK